MKKLFVGLSAFTIVVAAIFILRRTASGHPEPPIALVPAAPKPIPFAADDIKAKQHFARVYPHLSSLKRNANNRSVFVSRNGVIHLNIFRQVSNQTRRELITKRVVVQLYQAGARLNCRCGEQLPENINPNALLQFEADLIKIESGKHFSDVVGYDIGGVAPGDYDLVVAVVAEGTGPFAFQDIVNPGDWHITQHTTYKITVQ